LVVKHQVENQIGLIPDIDDLLAMARTKFKATTSLEASTIYLVLPLKAPVKS